jgi:signal transduction histidine kinase
MSDDDAARILIVDDEPMGIEIAARALGPEFTCEFALSGPEALARLDGAAAPDLILLDVLMPGMDGHQLCRWLKSDPRTRDIPVVFMTAANDPDSETSALLAGGADFIPKPVNPEVLRLRVRMQILLREREGRLRRLNSELEAAGLSEVFGDILELSDLETNQILLNPQPFTPADLHARLHAAIGPAASAKNLALRLDLDALPPHLWGDLQRLSQLLIQLLGNAVKFTTTGSVGLGVRVLGEAGERLRLAFEVRDTGSGVPPAARQRIFLPFEQGGEVPQEGGTGLGLTIARQLAGLMNGSLRLTASDEHGSTFVAEVWMDRLLEPPPGVSTRPQ